MSGAYDFVVDQGATFSKVMTWTIDDVPVNLSSWSARMQVRRSYGSDTTLLDITDGNGITLNS